MYTVRMINFDMDKGSFPTLHEAIEHARKLGFQCSISLVLRGQAPLHICNVNPY